MPFDWTQVSPNKKLPWNPLESVFRAGPEANRGVHHTAYWELAYRILWKDQEAHKTQRCIGKRFWKGFDECVSWYVDKFQATSSEHLHLIVDQMYQVTHCSWSHMFLGGWEPYWQQVYWFIWGVFLLKLPGYLDRTDV
jgi:hypothetical protein